MTQQKKRSWLMKLFFGDCQESYNLQNEVLTQLEIEKDRLLANKIKLEEIIVQLKKDTELLKTRNDNEIIGLKTKLLALTQYSTRKENGLSDEQKKQFEEFLGGQNIKNKDYEIEKGKKRGRG